MRTTNTFGIQFIIRSNNPKSGRALLYCRITVDSRRIELSLKKQIDPKIWNSVSEKVKGSSDAIKTLNHFIEEVRARLMECYQEMQIQKQIITADAIKDKFIGADAKEHTLSKLVDYHNTTMKETLEWGTQKNYFTTQKYIDKFLAEKFKSREIYLSELTYKIIMDFEYFLRTYKPVDHHKPIGNNGVMKHMERFRKMINLAIKLDWMKNDPFAKYKQKFDKFERGYLTKDELALIEHHSLKIDRLTLVRDLFVFSCYTGLAYIDLKNLSKNNIAEGVDGKMWIKTRRKKTSNPVPVPLLPSAIVILEKYAADKRSQFKDTLLPVLSNQKLNSYLKEIADVCGIKKDLTFHLARHTFATTVTLSNGVPIETVSKMLGHSLISTTQVYAKVIERKVSEDMAKLKSILAERHPEKSAT